MITDPVADTLIRIKNGYLASRFEVTIPYSKMSLALVSTLKRYGFIEDFKKNTRPDRPHLSIYLYEKDKKTFTDVKQISKPGRRIYVNKKNIPIIRDGFGVCILSTPKGILTGEEARKQNVGGELLAKVW
ncbi:30S ribosomal protein S8 [Patescibacteria group bacterium]|nr:30S ribosomal protein S8 [Patescibacteria group bacterium]MBU1867872.1 30S ribosomal protein S8 [Patescibacteria group bacterium]